MSVRDGNGAAETNEPSQPLGSVESGTKRPFGVVVASAVGGFRTLLRQHVELAKLESTEAASVRAQGAGMMAGAAVMALFAVGFAAAAAAAGLALMMPTWAAILIVAVVFLVVAGVLMLVGRGALRKAPTAERTREALKEDARWAKRQIAR
jgi:MFS family permease